MKARAGLFVSRYILLLAARFEAKRMQHLEITE
jgi:hypothetical protein